MTAQRKRRKRRPEPVTYAQLFKFYAFSIAYLAVCSVLIDGFGRNFLR